MTKEFGILRHLLHFLSLSDFLLSFPPPNLDHLLERHHQDSDIALLQGRYSVSFASTPWNLVSESQIKLLTPVQLLSAEQRRLAVPEIHLFKLSICLCALGKAPCLLELDNVLRSYNKPRTIDWLRPINRCRLMYRSRLITLPITNNMPSFKDRTRLNKILSCFDLPPELRNIIYTNVILAEGKLGDGPTCEVALMRTCHEVRDECEPLFYRLRRFPLPIQAEHGLFGDLQTCGWFGCCPDTMINRMRSFQACVLVRKHEVFICIDLIARQGEAKVWLAKKWRGSNRPLQSMGKYWHNVYLGLSPELGQLLNRLERIVESMSVTPGIGNLTSSGTNLFIQTILQARHSLLKDR